MQEADNAGGSLSIDSVYFLRDNSVQVGASIVLEDGEQGVSLSCSLAPPSEWLLKLVRSTV